MQQLVAQLQELKHAAQDELGGILRQIQESSKTYSGSPQPLD
jgi:hypothetical protein